jgi:phosphomannomutase
MNEASTLKIGISGVRGVVGQSLTPQLAAALAQAFGTYLGGGTVIVGRDSRGSGEMIKAAVTAGLLAVGCQPVDIGISATPSIQVYTRASRAEGAIEITASHNPKEWNGLKFISGAGLFLNRLQVEEFLDIYHQGDFSLASVERLRERRTEPDPTRPHRDRLLAYFDRSLIAGRRFKVVIDCGNGAGAVFAPRFLEELGCRAVLLNAVPDGAFVHGPEPVPENITGLCAAVKAQGAEVGFVQDADADRLAVVDERGEPLGEEMTLALAAEFVLRRTPGALVTNVSTTRAIDDLGRKYGVPVFRTPTGEINVVEKLLALGDKAALGGEGNGGVILPDVHPCRDSFTAMAAVLALMASTGRTPSELRRQIPEYHLLKDKIPGTREQASRLIRLLRKKYEGRAALSLADGLKVEWPDHWALVRPSNTEPIIRLAVEARTEAEAGAALSRLKKDLGEVAPWKS